MQLNLKSISSAAALCAAVLTFTSTTQAGPMSGMRVIDAPSTNNSHEIQPGDDHGRNRGRDSHSSASLNRHGADDPANHDAGDDRGHDGRGHH